MKMKYTDYFFFSNWSFLFEDGGREGLETIEKNTGAPR